MIRNIQRNIVGRYHILKQFEQWKQDDLLTSKLEQFKKALNIAATIQKQIDQNTQQSISMQQNAIHTTNTPIKVILASFMQQRELGNQDVVGNTFQYLAEIINSRGNRTYFDHTFVQQTVGFDLLIKDLLNVTDHQVLAQSIKAISQLPFQIQEEQQLIDLAFSLIKPYNQNQKIIFQEFLQEMIDENQPKFKDDLLGEFEQIISQTQQDLFTVIDAIIEIRKIYYKLTKLSSEEFIDINTNIMMLEFEESLISAGLLMPIEVQSRQLSKDLELAINYITMKEPSMFQFILKLLEISLPKYRKPLTIKPKQPDYGQLLVSLSLLKGKDIASKLLQIVPIIKDSNPLLLSQTFTNVGLYEQGLQYLPQIETINTLEELHLYLQLNVTNKQLNLPQNLTILTLNDLIAIATYKALQQQQFDEVESELKDRLDNLQSIEDLTSQQQERIKTLENYLNRQLLYLENNIQHTEIYNAIKTTLPQNVHLIEIYDTFSNNQLNGYAKLRVGQQQYLTINDFLTTDKQLFKNKIISAFQLEKQQITLFQQIKKRLQQYQFNQTNQDILDPITMFKYQFQYLQKTALSHLNQQDELNQLLLKQTLLDIQERFKILKINYSFQDLIDQIKLKPINFPKCFNLIPSQSIYDAQSTLDGFKVSLLSNQIYNHQYCGDDQLLYRLSVNGLLSDLMTIPNHQKRRQQLAPAYPLAWKQHQTQKTDEELDQLNSLYKFLKNDQKSAHPDQSDFFIVNLLNLNAELRSQPLPQIVDIIFNQDFWDKLINERIQQQNNLEPNGFYIDRNPESLIKQQLQKPQPNLTISYLESKLKQNETIKDLFEMRKKMMKEVREKVKNQTISKQEALKAESYANKIIQDKIEEIKSELNSKHTTQYFEAKTNYIDVQFDVKDLERLSLKQQPDNYLDTDLLHGLSNFVALKRSRAEEKLITYYLMLKQYQGIKLNKNEQQFLDSLELYQPKISITQLKASDIKINNLIHSNLSKFNEFSASDVILELSHLFDDQLFNDILLKKYYRSQGVQYRMRNRDNQLYLQQQEKLIWIDQQRLNSNEISDLKEMLELVKVSDQYVDVLNKTDYPLQNIFSWIHAKSQEKENVSLLQKRNNPLWQSIFKCDYDQTTGEQLHEVVEQLLERYYIFQFHPVQQLRELLRMILTHKNLSLMDRQNLGCLRKTAEFNSEDILQICQSEPLTEVPSYLKEMCYPYQEQLNF